MITLPFTYDGSRYLTTGDSEDGMMWTCTAVDAPVGRQFDCSQEVREEAGRLLKIKAASSPRRAAESMFASEAEIEEAQRAADRGRAPRMQPRSTRPVPSPEALARDLDRCVDAAAGQAPEAPRPEATTREGALLLDSVVAVLRALLLARTFELTFGADERVAVLTYPIAGRWQYDSEARAMRRVEVALRAAGLDVVGSDDGHRIHVSRPRAAELPIPCTEEGRIEELRGLFSGHLDTTACERIVAVAMEGSEKLRERVAAGFARREMSEWASRVSAGQEKAA